MIDLARLILDADTSGLKRAEQDLKGVSGEAARTAKDVGRSMQKLGAGLTAGVTVPLGLFGKQAFQAAVDAEEMQSAFNVVFGEMAEDVRAWSEATGNAMGRSTQEIQRGALAFQELFGKSLDPAQAAELSKEFAVLTQDLASFKNLSNEVAQQKLFSGLVGEAEPLRAVGVFLSEAAVGAKAAELGLEGVNGKLTDQEKIVARAAIIQEQLATAQGDVLRTSTSTANQIKTANAAFEELSISVGAKLLPAMTPLITALAGAVDWFAQLPDGVQTTVVAVAALAAAAGPLLLALGTFVTLAPAIASGLGLIKAGLLAIFANPVVLGAAALITGIYLAWQNWDDITAIVGRVGEAVSSWWSQNISPTFASLKKGLSDTAQSWGVWASDVWQSITRATNAFVEFHVQVVRLGADLIAGLVRGIRENATAVLDAISGVVTRGINRAKELLGIQSPSRVFMGIGEFLAEGFALGIEQGGAFVQDAMTTLAEQAQTDTQKIGRSFENMAQSVVGSLRGLAGSIQSGGFLDILGGVIGLFQQVANTGALKGLGIEGARADGGAVSAGKTYLVGERGPELVTMGGNGFVTPNNAMSGNIHVTVGVDPNSGNLTAFVNKQIGQAIPINAAAGAALARGQAAQSNSRRYRR